MIFKVGSITQSKISGLYYLITDINLPSQASILPLRIDQQRHYPLIGFSTSYLILITNIFIDD